MKRLLVSVVLSLILVSCGKPPPPPAATVDLTVPYSSADDAAVAMLQIAMSETKSSDYEYGGFVVVNGDKYYASLPVTDKDTDRVDYIAKVPADYKIVAIYHTHPKGFKSEQYSGVDVQTSKNLQVNSYLGVIADRSIRIFIPGFTSTFADDPAANGGVGLGSYGTIIASYIKK
jgi:proteasome lid subunit RPN8/RPN11